MPRFYYTAFAEDGSEVSGEVAASSELQALDQISRRGLIPAALTATESQKQLHWWERDLRWPGSSSDLARNEQQRVVAMLASLLGARLPLLRALAFCHDQTSNKSTKRSLMTVQDAVVDGASLSAALSAAKPGFSKDVLRLVEAGEVSNRVDVVLNQAAAAMTTEARIRREIASALIYPALLLALGVVVLLILALYLAPTLQPVFASSGLPAPFVLRILSGLGDLIKTGWPIILAVGSGLMLATWLSRSWLSALGSSLAVRMPVIGPMLRKRETLRATTALKLMLDSGAPLLQAIIAAQEATGNPHFVAALVQAEKAVISGQTLSSVLTKSTIFDPMARTLIIAAEESDQLSTSLATVNSTLETQIALGTTQLLRLLTPILTLVIGLGVGSVVLATIGAIMEMNDLAI